MNKKQCNVFRWLWFGSSYQSFFLFSFWSQCKVNISGCHFVQWVICIAHAGLKQMFPLLSAGWSRSQRSPPEPGEIVSCRYALWFMLSNLCFPISSCKSETILGKVTHSAPYFSSDCIVAVFSFFIIIIMIVIVYANCARAVEEMLVFAETRVPTEPHLQRLKLSIFSVTLCIDPETSDLPVTFQRPIHLSKCFTFCSTMTYMCGVHFKGNKPLAPSAV